MKEIPVEHAPFEARDAPRGPKRPPNAAWWDAEPFMVSAGAACIGPAGRDDEHPADGPRKGHSKNSLPPLDNTK